MSEKARFHVLPEHSIYRARDRWITQRLRDELDDDEFMRISFPRGSRRGGIVVPMSDRYDLNGLEKALAGKGVELPRNQTDRRSFLSNLFDTLPDDAELLVRTTGWHDRSFVLPGGTISPPGIESEPVLRGTNAVSESYVRHSSGTLRGFNENVARPALGSSYASFAIMHALAAPLMRFARLPEGAIFHLAAIDGTDENANTSSQGKSTAIAAGAAVSGRAVDKGMVKLPSWQGTIRGLQERAAAHCDIQFILDDTETLRPERASLPSTLRKHVHLFTSGSSAAYADNVRGSLPTLAWRCLAISSGPRTLRAELAKEPQHLKSDGDTVRFIDLIVPPAHDGGIWDLKGGPLRNLSPAERSEALKNGCAVHYGRLLPEWIKYVVQHQDDLAQRVPQMIGEYVEMVAPGSGGTERRIVQKMGLNYTAGELAVEAGLLDWPSDHPRKVMRVLFQRLAEMDEQQSRRKQATVEAFRARVQNMLSDLAASPKTQNFKQMPDAFRRKSRDRQELCLRHEEFERLCGPKENVAAIKEWLMAANAIHTGSDGKATQQVRVLVNGEIQKSRYLVINTRCLTS